MATLDETGRVLTEEELQASRATVQPIEGYEELPEVQVIGTRPVQMNWPAIVLAGLGALLIFLSQEPPSKPRGRW